MFGHALAIHHRMQESHQRSPDGWGTVGWCWLQRLASVGTAGEGIKKGKVCKDGRGNSLSSDDREG